MAVPKSGSLHGPYAEKGQLLSSSFKSGFQKQEEVQGPDLALEF